MYKNKIKKREEKKKKKKKKTKKNKKKIRLLWFDGRESRETWATNNTYQGVS